MARLRKYPGASDEGEKNPFNDEQGNNPFADRETLGSETEAPNANVYTSGVTGNPVHAVGGFETTLPHRGGVIFTMGLVGILGAAILAFCWPVLFLNLLVTLPAWLMGQADLRAMRAGAMNTEGRGMTLAGYVMGILGTCGTVLLFVVMAWISFKLSPLW